MYDAVLRLAGAGYDFIITSQTQFNSIVKRVAANQYQFKSQYKSIYIKSITGGFAMSGSSSPLSGGDTWGYLQTNNCELIMAEGGASINFSTTQGYIYVNTADCKIYNLTNLGSTTSANAIEYGFRMDTSAVRSSLINCTVKGKNTTSNMIVFAGSNNAATDKTIKYINCSMIDIESASNIGIHGFRYCENIVNSYINDIDITAGHYIGFEDCNNIDNFKIDDIDADSTSITGSNIALNSENLSNGYINNVHFENDAGAPISKFFESTDNISNVLMISCLSGASEFHGFSGCDNLNNCIIDDCTTTYVFWAFSSCNELTSCIVRNLTISPSNAVRAFTTCRALSGCIASGWTITGGTQTYGFFSCFALSGCRVTTIASTSTAVYGITTCWGVSGCYVDTISSTTSDVAGIYSTKSLSGCWITTIDHNGAVAAKNAYGFLSCDYASACYATDIDTDGGGGVANGFNSCNYLSSCSTSEAANAGNDYVDTTDVAIGNKFSCHPTNWT